MNITCCEWTRTTDEMLETWDLILAQSSLFSLFLNEITKGLPHDLSCILAPKLRLSFLHIFTQCKSKPRPTRSWVLISVTFTVFNAECTKAVSKQTRSNPRCPSRSCLRKAKLPVGGCNDARWSYILATNAPYAQDNIEAGTTRHTVWLRVKLWGLWTLNSQVCYCLQLQNLRREATKQYKTDPLQTFLS